MGIFLKPLQCYGAPACVPQHALQLVTAMRRNRRVGVQREPVDPGTARAHQGGAFPCIAKA